MAESRLFRFGRQQNKSVQKGVFVVIPEISHGDISYIIKKVPNNRRHER